MTQTIRRAPRRRQFVVIEQRAVEDGRLSWAARGLPAYLLSRADDWQVRVTDLKRRGDLKRDGIYKLLRELRDYGYLAYETHRDPSGQIRGGTYTVYEVPLEAAPDTDLPDTAGPDTAPPGPVKPGALPNTEVNLTTTTHTLPTTTHYGTGQTNHPAVRFENRIPAELRTEAARLIGDLAPQEADRVINEWMGAWQAGKITTSPLGYLAALVRRSQEGTLVPRHAHRLAP